MSWVLSEAARSASERVASSELPYNGAGPWVSPCVNLETIPGHMLQLIALMRRHHPWIRSVSPIRPCERRRDGTLSMHATGRAADIMVPVQSGLEGAALANWLVENAKSLGVQLVIWDHAVWQGSLPVTRRFTAYTGANPHVDHVHVELTSMPGPLLSPPTAPIAPQLMAFVRAVIAPALNRPGLIATRTRRPSRSWVGAGALAGAGAATAYTLATKRSAPASLAVGAIVGALLGFLVLPATASRTMRY